MDTSIIFIIMVYCSIVAFIQIIMQILIAAGSIDGNSDALKMYGFQEPEKDIDWLLYLTFDLLLCISSIILWYLHRKRNEKYQWKRLNVINVEKVLYKLSKNLPFHEESHDLTNVLEEDDSDLESKEDDDADSMPSIYSLLTQRTMLITAARMAKLPFFYQFFISSNHLMTNLLSFSVARIVFPPKLT